MQRSNRKLRTHSASLTPAGQWSSQQARPVMAVTTHQCASGQFIEAPHILGAVNAFRYLNRFAAQWGPVTHVVRSISIERAERLRQSRMFRIDIRSRNSRDMMNLK